MSMECEASQEILSVEVSSMVHFFIYRLRINKFILSLGGSTVI